MAQRKEAPAEIGLDEAASLLKMSEKTVRKYIKLKAIRAVKVANCWYVDRASLMSFHANVTKEAAGEAAPGSTSQPRSHPSKATQSKAGSLATAAIHNLACYRLFLAARDQLNFADETPDLAAFVDARCRDVLSHLGAGYYGFGAAKRLNYDKARAAIGSIIGVLAADAPLYQRHQKAAQFLERDVLPAFGSLMRKLDGRGSDPHRKSGGSAQVNGRVP